MTEGNRDARFYSCPKGPTEITLRLFVDLVAASQNEIFKQSQCDFCRGPVEDGKHFTSLLVPEKKFCNMGCADDFEDELTGEHK